jgi:branched-chain amino acid transport system substrate-binding protein
VWRRARIALAFVFVCCAVAGCGGHGRLSRPPVRGGTVDVFASLPLHGVWGPQGTAIANGVGLALNGAGGAAGRWRVRLVLLDDSAGAASVAQDARRASTNPATVYYIGELDSAATEISAPLLNVAGVAQVSPLATAESAGARALDPTGRPSFLRLAPPDSTQAAAQLDALAHARCRRVAVVHDGSLEGAGLAAALDARRGQLGVRIVRVESLGGGAGAAAGLAARLRSAGADCVVFAGTASSDAVALLSSLGKFRVVLGSYGVCTQSVLVQLPASVRGAFRCTLPVGDLGSSAAGRAFFAAYGAAHGGGVPDPLAAYGYEAMRLGLDTIARLGARGGDKRAVRAALFAVRSRRSLLGLYGFDRVGNSTLGTYGLYRVGASGAPVFAEGLRP